MTNNERPRRSQAPKTPKTAGTKRSAKKQDGPAPVSTTSRVAADAAGNTALKEELRSVFAACLTNHRAAHATMRSNLFFGPHAALDVRRALSLLEADLVLLSEDQKAGGADRRDAARSAAYRAKVVQLLKAHESLAASVSPGDRCVSPSGHQQDG
jgi:hypothetical protein